MFTVFFTAIGRRVELIKAFQASFTQKNIEARIIGSDANPQMASAGYFLNDVFRVPRVNEPGYVEALLALCRQQQVNVLVPLFEPEFAILNEYRQMFMNSGTFVLLSRRETIRTCSNKYDTHKFFQDIGVKTPATWLGNDLPDNLSFPLFIKPCYGMGSQGAQKVSTATQLDNAIKYTKDMLVQQYIKGIEYTLDVLADLKGNVLSVVPRERLEVRAGEVSKGKTVDRPDLIRQAVHIVEKLGAIGPLTLQCIDTGREVYWIEINPRFGGGVPLAIKAGVDYPFLLYRLLQGEKIAPFIGEYTKNLGMLRYDEAVYIPFTNE